VASGHVGPNVRQASRGAFEAFLWVRSLVVPVWCATPSWTAWRWRSHEGIRLSRSEGSWCAVWHRRARCHYGVSDAKPDRVSVVGGGSDPPGSAKAMFAFGAESLT
jgi:hypothetical protein